jgi:putative two-component system response regulator
MVRKNVLLVDDDPVFVEAVSAVLETRYEVRTAANGTEALAQITAVRPDLIVLDVMMDHLSEGFDVARTLRSDPETAAIPIVMLTAVDQVYNVRMEVEESWVPCERYLEKPVPPETLLATIAELIG